MDFDWSQGEVDLRQQVRNVLDELVPATRGLDAPGLRHTAEDSRAVCRRLADEGLLVPHWPAGWGGADAPPWFQHILAEEMWRYGEPRAPQYLNVNFIGPAIMRWGTAEQQQAFLPPMAAGEALWCQAFSEPDAGSDLSRIRTSARPDESGYRVSGTKQWISYADVAEHCFLLARLAAEPEDSDRGDDRIVLLVPMTTRGITVREIPSIVGPHVFHEVHFDEAWVPADARLGAEGEGWKVVTTALTDERVGAPEYMQSEHALRHALLGVSKTEVEVPAALDARIGEALVRCAGARLLTYRAVDERVHGGSDVAPAFAARAYQRLARQAVADSISELSALLDGRPLSDPEPLNAMLIGVAGGAYEIQLDLVARSLLGSDRR